MDKKQESDENPVMEMLRRAFPGRSDDRIVAIGLVYAGMRWGKDYRFCEVPEDEQGSPINVCFSENCYRRYLDWLAEHLYRLDAEPIEEQKGLCRYIDRMGYEEAIQLIGMNAALYQFDTEPIESWIIEGSSFSEYAENMRNIDGQDFDEEIQRELFERVRMEIEEYRRCCQDVKHADAAYRVPLARVLQREELKGTRIELLDRFYKIYDEYLWK